MFTAYNICYIHPHFGITYCPEKGIDGKQFLFTTDRKKAIRRVTALRMAGVQAWFEPNTAENEKRYNKGIMHR